MKVQLFSLAAVAVCQLIGNGLANADQQQDSNLRYFKLGELSDGFKRYEVTGCAQDVNTCIREMHESVKGCVEKWKQQAGERFDHCVNNDQVVVNANKEWQRHSLSWHKGMDQCLQGTEAPSQEALNSWHVESAAMAYYSSRKKRDAAASDEVATCWRTARQKRDQCKQKAVQCTQFAHCYGEGPEPSSESAKRWYNHVKHCRDETKRTSKTHIMHMGHCLRNEPHTGDHGGGAHGDHGLHNDQ